MSQQFRVDSEKLRDKLNGLLPSQNKGSIGVDLSGSTTIIPIVDLTETAEGSDVRQDLQTAFSLTSATVFEVNNTTSTILTTTGYFRIFGSTTLVSDTPTQSQATVNITDGVTTKEVYNCIMRTISATQTQGISDFDFTVLLKAGDSLTMTATQNAFIAGSARQIADLSGNLINP